jgi:uncharacterized protein YjbI with pentapeptide repeats
MAKEQYYPEDIHIWLEDNESLEDVDLSGGHLIGAHFPKINLKGASFQEADLRYANLAGAILEGANFAGAWLTGIKLSGANLIGANFEGAHIENADFVRADLRKACFKRANLSHCTLRSSKLNGTDFSEANLRGANFHGASDCLSATFDKANLCGTRLDLTGLDKLELIWKGCKVDNFTELHNRVYVLKSIKTSWVEFLPQFLKRKRSK